MRRSGRGIGDYGLIGDGQSAALVDRAGSLDWLCWPRFDSKAIFASLLGTAENGLWSLCPASAFETSRRYRRDTAILETTFRTETGVACLTDFMARGDGPRALVRRLRCIEGEMTFVSIFKPRASCGARRPSFDRSGRTLRIAADGVALALSASRPEVLVPDEEVTLDVQPGDGLDLILTDDHSAPAAVSTFAQSAHERCDAFWQAWAGKCTYQGPWRDAVLRSLITLKSLIYQPTGGIVAAPTSSLPERIGGHRNWDYRFCWLRDSTFTVLALLHAGYVDEAGEWANWLVHAMEARKGRTQPFYGVVPNNEIDEFEADWLAGFKDSRPVRFGNGARDQLQLGIYGEVQDTLHQWRVSTRSPEASAWRSQCKMLSELGPLTQKPDAGIWEQRGHLEHFTQSRALAWVAYDRAIRSREAFGLHGDDGWETHRAKLHAEVCENGFDTQLDSFSRAYGSRSLDASCLLLAMVGFLPPDDPRIEGTVRAIQSHLSDGPFLYRYDTGNENDGVGGPEGAFLPCSFWLADNFILQRNEDAGASLLETLLGASNDLGLYSEEYDVSAKQLLGNFPQALTHLSLVHTALNLTGAGPAQNRSNTAY